MVLSIEGAIQTLDSGFRSPRARGSPISEWEAFAYKRAKAASGPRADALLELSRWYGALKLLIISWEEDAAAAAALLQMYAVPELYAVPTQSWRPPQLCQKARAFFAGVPATHRRFERLQSALLGARDQFAAAGHEFRGIVFVQQRISAHILQYLVERSAELRRWLRPTVVYSASAPAAPTLSVPLSVQRKALRDFAAGKCNILFTTTVAEEGLDVAAANCVICFDAMQNVVSLVQRRGRARQANSVFLVLSEQTNRRVRDLEKAERLQRAWCSRYAPEEQTPAQALRERNERRAKQRNRERDAQRSLQSRLSGNPIMEENSLECLHLFAKKTKVDVVEATGRGTCVLRYSSCLRECEGVGHGRAKPAKRQAAAQLLRALLTPRATRGAG